MQQRPVQKRMTLPPPDAESAAHSAKVVGHLRRLIGDGSISFAEYMHEALYAPGLGYYVAGARKFGAGGDFVTAPETSSLFGAVVARQAAEILASVSGGDILEFGAGSGRLACDVLQAMACNDTLPFRYRILEVSPDLQQRQRDALQSSVPEHLERVEWIDALPQDFRGVMLANEVLDALPCERFAVRDSGHMQQRVAVQDSMLCWAESAAREDLAALIGVVEQDIGCALPVGYCSEISPAASQWVRDLASSLTEGAIFLFDYGVTRREYYAPDRSDGWLRCHFRHHAHNDPLVLPGIQDITTWVDFSAVAGAAFDAGLDVLGYQTQAQFLLGGGLQQELDQMTTMPTKQRLALSAAVKTLTLPGEMGERFKVLALGRGAMQAPSCFDFADRTETL